MTTVLPPLPLTLAQLCNSWMEKNPLQDHEYPYTLTCVGILSRGPRQEEDVDDQDEAWEGRAFMCDGQPVLIRIENIVEWSVGEPKGGC
jgi:hypothetical protein